jgi:hypothetical protein
MAAFPNIEPTARSYGLGAHPIEAAAFSSGDEVRFLHGATSSGVPIALEFRALSSTDATAIRDHYLSQKEHQAFTIPAHLWRTHASATDVVPSTHAYVYAGRPQESPRSGGLVDVAVSIISVF